MLMLLIRDGVIYFGVVFAAFLFNLLVWAFGPVSPHALHKICLITHGI